MKTVIKEEYVAFIKCKDSGKYYGAYSTTTASTIEKAKERFEQYRKNWERDLDFDFNDVQFRHRTVVTTTGEWEVVG